MTGDNEDNVMVLGKGMGRFIWKCVEITSFNGFSYKSSNEDEIDINYNNKERQATIRKDKHGQRH